MLIIIRRLLKSIDLFQSVEYISNSGAESDKLRIRIAALTCQICVECMQTRPRGGAAAGGGGGGGGCCSLDSGLFVLVAILGYVYRHLSVCREHEISRKMAYRYE